MVLLDRGLDQNRYRTWFGKNWLRVVVHVAVLIPLALLVRDYALNLFLVDPVREITTRTGRAALTLLLLSLACTPIITLTGWRQVARVRRALGLYATLFMGLHFLTFVGLDYAFDPVLLRQAILDQRFVLAGGGAGLILLLLAVTSTQGWQKRLRRRWKQLHRLVYLAGTLAVVHFLWLSKDAREPLRYAAVLATLLLFRVPAVRSGVSRTRRRFLAAFPLPGWSLLVGRDHVSARREIQIG